jgi:hypothetical protein
VRCKLGYEYRGFLLRDAFLEEDFVTLSEDDTDEELDYVPTKVGGGSVEEVLVDVGEHSGTRPEVVVGPFEAFGVGSILATSDGGMGSCDEEDDGSLFVSDGGLGDLFVRESVSPGEIDPNLWESKFHEFQLAEILVEEIAS